jgi:hypothetical protein
MQAKEDAENISIQIPVNRYNSCLNLSTPFRKTHKNKYEAITMICNFKHWLRLTQRTQIKDPIRIYNSD